MLDNNVDVWILQRLQGLGVSVVQLPHSLRDASDEAVLAEAKRQDRVLVTHDLRFVDPKQLDPIDNPGIVIIPNDGHGGFDWGLIVSVLAHIYVSRYSVDQTVVRVYPSGRITIWNPNENTGAMEPVFCRLNDENEIEVWLDADGEFAANPDYD